MLPICRVHCAVFDNDGAPIAGAVITARLDRFEVVPDGYVVPDLETSTTDAAGACVLPLWPNALGNTASFYNIKIQAPNGKSLRLTAVVPDVPDIDLQQIAALPPYEGKPDGQIILDQAIAASLETFAARDRAELAAEYVQPVYDYLPHIQTVSESIDAVSTVAEHIDNVDVVAEHIDSVDTVAERAQAVDTVADRIQDVIDVAAIDAAVAQVAANLADVSNFGLIYQGARATNPSTRADGSPLQDGDLYFNTVSRRMRAYATGAWEDYEAQAEAAADVATAAAEVAAEKLVEIEVRADAITIQTGLATQSATTAANAAATATDAAQTATEQADLATLAALDAEVARDAAQLSAGVFPSTSAGLAATVESEYFSVPSSDPKVYLTLYRNDAGAVATQVAQYPSLAGINYSVAGTLYVSANGSNANDGRSPRTAVRHIERALELAELSGEPTLIEWAPETPVLTQGHLDVPDNCVIKAAHRTVFLRPAAGFEERNVFRLGSGCFLEGVMFEGWRLDSLDDPSEGFAVSFRPGAVINRVPYAHKIAVRSIPTWGAVAPPLDRRNGNPLVPRGGGVALADGAVCAPYSIFPNIMTWGATPVAPNGIGYCAKNGGLINAVNAVSMWAHKHFMALSGGQIILSACSTQFGDYSLHARGYRNIVLPEAVSVPLVARPLAAQSVLNAQAPILDSMWNALVAEGYTTGWGEREEYHTRNDGALLLRCLAWTLESANQQPMQDFAKGLFDTVGVPVFSADKLAAFLFSFDHIRSLVNVLPGFDQPVQTMVNALFSALAATLSDPQTRKEASRITAIGHTWTAVMSGVALTKIPPANNAATIRDSILEEDDGVVIASGQDDQGNALFVGGLEISADTGELGGPPFDQAVRRVATRAAIARSF